MAKKETKKQVNLCWITGSYFRRKDFIAKIREYLSSKGEFETAIFDSDHSFEYCKNQILQSSCFCEQRLFIFNDWPQSKTTKDTLYKHFMDLCSSCPEDVVIICNNLETSSKKVLSFMESNAKVVEFEQSVKTRAAAGWFVGEMEKLDKVIEESDADVVVSSIGEKEGSYSIDVDKMISVAKKLSDYVGKRKKITNEDVLTVCFDDADFIIWSLYDYLDSGDYCGCMNLVLKAESLSRNVQEFVNSMFFSLLWRYKLIFLLIESSEQKWGEEKVIEEVLKLQKLSRTGQGMFMTYGPGEEKKPIYSRKMIENTFNPRFKKPPVLCYSRKQIYLILLAIQQAQQRVREGVSNGRALILLDAVFMTICNQDYQESLFK